MSGVAVPAHPGPNQGPEGVTVLTCESRLDTWMICLDLKALEPLGSPGPAFTGQMFCACLGVKVSSPGLALPWADHLEEMSKRLKIGRDHSGLGSHFVLIYMPQGSALPRLSSQ